MEKELKLAVEAALEAGRVIMDIYNSENYAIMEKEDLSPLTIADTKANDIINSYLVNTKIPIISEENAQLSFKERKHWRNCWIVDPLDGTKEFIKRNGEFTVNIAYVTDGEPVLGVIFAPALSVLYFAVVSQKKAFKIENITEFESLDYQNAIEIKPCQWEKTIKVVGSRSHMNEETLNFIEDLKNKLNKEVEIVTKGSSLKFCMVAEGEAHIYPRYAPTMEWDTAAGQAICEAVGLSCRVGNIDRPLGYNKETFLNPNFWVSSLF